MIAPAALDLAAVRRAGGLAELLSARRLPRDYVDNDALHTPNVATQGPRGARAVQTEVTMRGVGEGLKSGCGALARRLTLHLSVGYELRQGPLCSIHSAKAFRALVLLR